MTIRPFAERRSLAMPEITRRLGLMLLAVALLTSASAGASALRASTAAELQSDLAKARSVLDACATSRSACNADALPTDEQIGDPGRPGGYVVHWSAARAATDAAARETDAGKRRDRVQPAEAGLDAMEADLRAPSHAPAEFARARRDATAVLARPEFQRAGGPTWIDRLEARVLHGLGQLFGGLGRLSSQAPWLPVALEWLCFAGAAAALLVLAQRALARQRLRVALGGGVARPAEWETAPAEWARDADRLAGAGDWRQAIHCLYWAAIVLLEERRAWRHNPARTPRDYVRLLSEGSARRAHLATLTGVFERVWYGLREASEPDYRGARDSFESLQREPATEGR